jgi:hypothetical protein
MARTLIVATANGAAGGGVNNVTFTNSTTALGMYFVNALSARLLARNLDAAPKTVTVASVTDSDGRTGDIVLTVPAANGGVPGLGYAGPFKADLFNQRGASDLGKVFVETSADTSLALAVVTDP